MNKKKKSKKEKIATIKRKNRKKQSPIFPVIKDTARISTIQIKKDLVKTLALSILAIGIVLVLYWD